ncbi:EspA/EspE family type VII secretion system effector [Mycolicibacterium moriokaense]|uniref:Uncharacterized protein n=1 Tax=Mycolicibacterium moriokaense TaxID=39691 RepID=A0A318HTV1_9MYCO|nr:hypothetical protein C8E89_101528 [Mycolicibacterium moriokaense]
MSVLNAFLSTWSNARQTYGEGTPQPGAQYDGSATLNRLQSTVQTAAPGSKWTGGAANAYGAANTEHGRVLGQLAGLDQRLSAHVDESAQVIAAGRRDLEAVRKWVVDASANLPQNAAGERMQMTIVQKGISQVQEIIQRSNGELNSIGGKIRGLGDEYQALGNQKFGPRDGPDFGVGQKVDEEEKRRQAEKDVHDALAGDENAAKRVEDALKGIKPGQQLTPEQGSYLSQMQAQQHGMSIDALKTAEQRLGDQKHIIGDSWQLTSNPDVNFPKTEAKIGALDDPSQRVKGGFDKLPQSVQSTLNQPDIQGAKDLQTIAGVVKDGHDDLQTNTELDRSMLKKASVMMDTPFWQQSADEYNIPQDQRLKWLDPVVSDTFSAVSPDHHAVHDAITTGPGHIDGINSDKFMQGVTHRIWADGGDGAGNLFEWTNNTGGAEAGIASETAEAYGKYLGQPGSELLDLPGHHTVGEINPKLVQAFSQGLAPYQAAMVGEDPQLGFKPLDDLGSTMDNTKRLFSVIDSDPTAAKDFNQVAYRHVLDYQKSFAELAAVNPDLITNDPRLDDLQSSARMLSAIDGGAAIHANAHIENTQDAAYDAAKQSYEFRKTVLDTVLGNVPQGDRVTAVADDVLLGSEPTRDHFKVDPTTGHVTNLGLSATEQEAQHTVTNAQYEIASRLGIHSGDPHFDARFFNDDGTLQSPAQVGEDNWSLYNEQLGNYLASYSHIDSALGRFRDTFDKLNGLTPPK